MTVEQNRFSDLELKRSGVHFIALQKLGHLFGKVRIAQLRCCNIDRRRPEIEARFQCFVSQRQCAFKRKAPEFHDLAVLLRNRNELRR